MVLGGVHFLMSEVILCLLNKATPPCCVVGGRESRGLVDVTTTAHIGLGGVPCEDDHVHFLNETTLPCCFPLKKSTLPRKELSHIPPDESNSPMIACTSGIKQASLVAQGAAGGERGCAEYRGTPPHHWLSLSLSLSLLPPSTLNRNPKARNS